jgi:hypothetical protein
MSADAETSAPRRRPGRPARTERPPVREAEVRAEAPREPVRERKTRTHKGAGVDQLRIPQHLIPPDIDLQWNTETIIGVPATQFENSRMQQQGWEPVTTGMFDGRFDYMMPKGHKGQIVYGSARLDWRPLELTLEARAEDLTAARQARGVEERKINAGAVDGVQQDFMNIGHEKARANTFIRKEFTPSMPIPD